MTPEWFSSNPNVQAYSKARGASPDEVWASADERRRKEFETLLLGGKQKPAPRRPVEAIAEDTDWRGEPAAEAPRGRAYEPPEMELPPMRSLSVRAESPEDAQERERIRAGRGSLLATDAINEQRRSVAADRGDATDVAIATDRAGGVPKQAPEGARGRPYEPQEREFPRAALSVRDALPRPAPGDAQGMADDTGYRDPEAMAPPPEEPRQGPPDRFQAEAEARARIIPDAVSAVRDRAAYVAEQYRAGVSRVRRAGQDVLGQGLSVLGATETGAALMRDAAEPSVWERQAAEGEARRAQEAPPPASAPAPEAAPAQPERMPIFDPSPRPMSVLPLERAAPAAAGQPRPGPTRENAAAALAGVAEVAPASAEAVAPAAQALSVVTKPGAAPNKNQYQRAAEAAETHFFDVVAPKLFTRYLETGRPDKAFAWKAFVEGKDARNKVNHFSRAVFATTMGDAKTAIEAASAAVEGSEIGDTYEIVEDKSAFLPDNDDLFARFTFRNKQTGEEFTQSFDTMEEFVGGLASIASAEAAFENAMAGFEKRRAAILESRATDAEKIAELTPEYFEFLSDSLGGQEMDPRERQRAAAAMAAETVLGSKAAAAGGLGALGVSQGGARAPQVPAIGAPNG